MSSRELDEKHRELLNKMREEEETIRMLHDEKKRLQMRFKSTPDDRTLEEINREILENEQLLKKLQDEYVNTPVVYPTRKLKPIIQYEDGYGNIIKEPLDKQGTFRYYYYPYGQLTAERAVVDVEDGMPKRIRFLEWHSDYGTGLPVTIEIPLEVGPIEFIKVVEKEVIKEIPKYVESDVTPVSNETVKSKKGILDKILKRGEKQ